MTKPKPIRDDPTQGQLQVVISFRVAGPIPREHIENFVRDRLADIHDLAVHVRVIGAGGEKSEMEGEWPPQGTRDGLERPEGVG